jgi:hypothetical protein
VQDELTELQFPLSSTPFDEQQSEPFDVLGEPSAVQLEGAWAGAWAGADAWGVGVAFPYLFASTIIMITVTTNPTRNPTPYFQLLPGIGIVSIIMDQ